MSAGRSGVTIGAHAARGRRPLAARVEQQHVSSAGAGAGAKRTPDHAAIARSEARRGGEGVPSAVAPGGSATPAPLAARMRGVERGGEDGGGGGDALTPILACEPTPSVFDLTPATTGTERGARRQRAGAGAPLRWAISFLETGGFEEAARALRSECERTAWAGASTGAPFPSSPASSVVASSSRRRILGGEGPPEPQLSASEISLAESRATTASTPPGRSGSHVDGTMPASPPSSPSQVPHHSRRAAGTCACRDAASA